MAEQRLLVVSPVRNEADHIVKAARSMAAQTRSPDLWLVVDDDSTDGTLAMLRELERTTPFLEVLTAQQKPETVGAADRLAVAAEALAFNAALAAVEWNDYTHIAKLDGDLELPPEYFARLLDEFASDAGLGMAGGIRTELHGSTWIKERIPRLHVPGGLKLYKRECFEAIGGIENRLGWDIIDETRARMLGWRTHSFDDLVVTHHRPWGSADGVLRGCARHGTNSHIIGQGLPWVLGRSLKVGLQRRPPIVAGIAYLFGYLKARITSAPRVDEPELRRFVRRELRGRALNRVRART